MKNVLFCAFLLIVICMKFPVIVFTKTNLKKYYYTFQLKSNKGLVVVIKSIEPEADPTEMFEAISEEAS